MSYEVVPNKDGKKVSATRRAYLSATCSATRSATRSASLSATRTVARSLCDAHTGWPLMDADCVAHQIHLGKFKSKLEAALVFYKYMQGLGTSAVSRVGGSKRYGNMLMEFEMPDAMEGGKANTIEKVSGALAACPRMISCMATDERLHWPLFAGARCA